MAELTITELRNLDELASNLLFAVDGDTETFNISLSTIFDYMKERLGYLETGAVEMYMGKVIPDTHTELDGKTFDPLVFPKMGALFPSGILPDTRGMTLKHVSNGRSVLSFESDNVKSHDHQATQESHAHTKGSMEILANFAGIQTGAWPDTGAVEYVQNVERVAGASSGGYLFGGKKFTASRSWSGDTSYAAPKVTVLSSGSSENTVKNIGVKFIIKKA